MTAVYLLMMLGVVVVGLLLLGGLNGRSDSSAARDRADLERARAELDGLQDLVADLKDLAYDHRELDSPLSTLFIDRIRTYERDRRRRELP